nr:hypothetical protein CJ211_02150 [Gardnerella vaginalis]PMC54056.1 hypothetical protein CJ210_03705 [Gardnerella vaginalis]
MDSMSCLQITQQTRRMQTRQKRQKLYSNVKFRSGIATKTAETVQLCKEKVGYAAKNGRNFTALQSLCRLRAKLARITRPIDPKAALPSQYFRANQKAKSTRSGCVH